MLIRAAAAQGPWDAMGGEARAGLLDRTADLFEAHRDEFYSLCIREAGKTLPDAVLEVREAVDFLRYYAAEARRLFTSIQQQWANLRRGVPGLLQPPVDSMEGRWSTAEQAGVEHALRYAFVGSPDVVRRGLQGFISGTHPDEIIVTAQIFEHAARVRSYEILAGLRNDLTPSGSPAD